LDTPQSWAMGGPGLGGVLGDVKGLRERRGSRIRLRIGVKDGVGFGVWGGISSGRSCWDWDWGGNAGTRGRIISRGQGRSQRGARFEEQWARLDGLDSDEGVEIVQPVTRPAVGRFQPR
jgi:hypothetical protein